MKLYPDSKVYILCPANLKTGGPESLHQLASVLISFGIKTYMAYLQLSGVSFDKEDPVHDAYKKYHVPYTYDLEGNTKNVVVVPETITSHEVGKIRRILWWMSVDNYLKNVKNVMKGQLSNPLAYPVPKFFTFDKADKSIEHWGQSEYVRQFLRLNGITDIKTVETHMSQTFLSHAAKVDLTAKKNIVAFNPLKGFDITQQLIKLEPEINWKPIMNMTPAQVQELLTQAKVYIDFGEFPGRERLPREAILSGCVVITGKRGASANDVDINIPAEFKFGLNDTKPYAVIKKIQEVFDDFATAYDKQKAFRDKEIHAQETFVEEVAQAFGIRKTKRGTIALTQGFGDVTSLLIERLKKESLIPGFIVDDVMSTEEMAKLSNGLIIREQNRNYLLDGQKLIEIITRDDAKFLYQEGRIKNFALLNPSDVELAEVKDFYEANDVDILIL